MNETEWLLKAFGELPELETCENVSAQEIIDKVKDFREKCDEDLMPYNFIELLSMYPKSFCKRDMSETLKRIITAEYVFGVQNPLESYELSVKEWKEGKRSEKPDKNDEVFKPYYSYEYLSVLFGRSKASIHEAISQFKVEYENLYFKRKDEYNEFQAWKKAKELSNKETSEQTNEQC
jgi:hypothetical protein